MGSVFFTYMQVQLTFFFFLLFSFIIRWLYIVIVLQLTYIVDFCLFIYLFNSSILLPIYFLLFVFILFYFIYFHSCLSDYILIILQLTYLYVALLCVYVFCVAYLFLCIYSIANTLLFNYCLLFSISYLFILSGYAFSLSWNWHM